jgi:UDP-N-acetyl-D-mannosaminuronate dehydrogenase
LISAARHVNDTQPNFAVDLIKSALENDVQGKHIAVLGLAFKPDVDDLRESPAIDVAKLLSEAGAVVSSFEPYATNANIPGVQNMPTLVDAIAEAYILVLLVGHKQLRELDPLQFRKMTPARLVVDAVGVLDGRAWSDAGFTLFRLGDGKK